MITLLAAALVATGPPSPSASKRQHAWLACVDAHVTNPEWAQCGVAYVKAADGALNVAWAKLMARATGQTRADLVKEERAWVAYKDAACAFYANGDWGREGEVLHVFGCRGGVIEARTRDLESYADFMSPK